MVRLPPHGHHGFIFLCTSEDPFESEVDGKELLLVSRYQYLIISAASSAKEAKNKKGFEMFLGTWCASLPRRVEGVVY